MPKLVIDNREIEVPHGTKVIEAAELLGIMIPRFCYHPGLGSFGFCRMCAVKFVEGPVKGVEMSCMTDASDNMVVSTTDSEVVEFRRYMVEWLMLHHPHDCPVCDEGGHCLLQDETVSGGHGIRRYLGKKRTFHDQYLGVFVQHEMNRCIHCWRCRNFYQDFAGYRDLGAMQLGNRTYFGRFNDGPLESPFSGNLIDICPTGVYTDKPSRFVGRRWDYQRGPSLCIHCSLGCHTVASVRYRDVVRLEARFEEAVNGYFICDRGRYGFGYTNHPERPRSARVGSKYVPWEQAIQIASGKLAALAQRFGPEAVACMGSIRSSIETQGMLKRLCQLRGWKEPAYFIDPGMERVIRQAVQRLDDRLAVSLRQIERSDFIAVAGVDPINEAPMLALAIRQAYRNGAVVVVIDPRPVFLPHIFDHLPVISQDIWRCLGTLVKAAVTRSVAEELGSSALELYDIIPSEYPSDCSINDQLQKLAAQLEHSCNPVIVCGTDIVPENLPALAADHALLLFSAKRQAGLFYVLSGANGFGAALLSSGGRDFISILEAIESSTVKALVLVESDPFQLFPDRQRLEQAIGLLDTLLVLDYVPSEAAQRAHILLPTRTLFETEAGFINQEGRLQFVQPVHHGGTPIAQISAGQHPPRFFRPDIPGAEAKAAWEALAEFVPSSSPPERKALYRTLWEWLAQENSLFADMNLPGELESSVRLPLGQDRKGAFTIQEPARQARAVAADDMELLLVDWTFGTEELSGYSNYTQQVEKVPSLFMQEQDAGRLGLKTGDRVRVRLDAGSLELGLCVVQNMARGVVVVPRHRQLDWKKIKTLPVRFSIESIEKIL
jgi:NADH-quinone oxidoreductase subunit G